MALIDRMQEFSLLTGLLEGAQGGNSAAMVLRGELGIGKTALLEAVSGSGDAQGNHHGRHHRDRVGGWHSHGRTLL